RKQRSHPDDRRAFGEPGIEQADVHIRELLQERLTSLRCETVKLAELWHASTVPLLPRGTDNARSWRAVSLQHHHVMTTTMKQERRRQSTHTSPAHDNAHRRTVTVALWVVHGVAHIARSGAVTRRSLGQSQGPDAERQIWR